jgi:hypothetical protein
MKRVLFLIGLMAMCLGVHAQFNNEWIDYSKTYYKFKVVSNGIYRINRATLDAAGIGGTPVEQFRLFRNGVEVPLFTSVASGALGGSDFIEFYGRMNDGKADNKLYRQVSMQPSDVWSLESDTSSYFLAVYPTGSAQRIASEVNDVAGNTLPAEQYFTYTFRKAFKEMINPGFAVDLKAAYVYSSSYDPGEGWSSRDIFAGFARTESMGDLAVFPGGPAAVLSVTASGNTFTARNIQVSINSTSIINEPLNYFAAGTNQANFASSVIGRPGGDQITLGSTTADPRLVDRMVVAAYSITYSRKFDFGGAKLFEFQLGANPAGMYVEIANFNAGSVAPILYDLTNRKRYIGSVSGGLVRFALKPSFQPRQMVLLNSEAGEIRAVSGLQVRNFVNFSQAANQGDYLIIAHKSLFNSSRGNPIIAYSAYRSSADGGGYKPYIADVEELYDQFAFGIREHPLAIKNYIAYGNNTFAVKPKNVLLVGRGTVYTDVRMNDSRAASHEINLIPTFGNPGSDNILASPDYLAVPAVPIGRIAAINGDEVMAYLDKVKEHEAMLRTAPQTVKDKAWMKNVVHAIGGSDPYLQSVIFGYMSTNRDVVEDTSYGGKVYTFSKNTSLGVEQITSQELTNLFAEGLSLLTYFGHSSQNTLEFNIDDPTKYDNKGKYPLFIVNGCNAGNIFTYDTLRRVGGGLSLSESYMLTKDRGSIGFLASSHFGIVNYLNIYTSSMYHSMSVENYGQTLGVMQKAALARLLASVPSGDFYGRMHAEQINLHGDPALRMYASPQPDYIIEEPFVKISPIPLSVAETDFKLEVKWLNIGRAIDDSFTVHITRQFPNGTSVQIYKQRWAATRYKDSIELTIPINPITDKGDNSIKVTIDSDDEIPELSESNNEVTLKFLIIDDELRPIAPYNYAIVNKQPITFYASTANPFASVKNYIIEVDTTELFNSSFKKSQTISSSGGLIQFNVPGLTLQDSTVYYWRTAQVPTGNTPLAWNTSSFVYLPNSTPGYNQSHYFQMANNKFSKITLDQDRALRFAERKREMVIRTGIIPIYINDRLQVTLDDDIVASFGCRSGSLQITVYDKTTMAPWPNSVQPNGLGRFNSWTPCANNTQAFEFPYNDPVFRKRAIDFLESIPAGTYVSITNLGRTTIPANIYDWMADTTVLGSGKSLYHTLKNLGFSEIDNYTTIVPFIFVTRIGNIGFLNYQRMGTAMDDYLEAKLDFTSSENGGTVESPWFGPALKWNKFSWSGKDLNPYTDKVSMEVYGKGYDGKETLLATVVPSSDTLLSFVDSKTYPFVKLRMVNIDSAEGTPNQLRYWRINADLPPEGAIAPSLSFNAKDSVEVGEPYMVQVAFKNISQTAFDSVAMQMTITDASNTVREIKIPKQKPVAVGDTIVFRYPIDTKSLVGDNTVFLNFNPNFAQPEQYLFNNFMFKPFKVKGDGYNPTLDVTFDGVRILNRDIVSSRPNIQIKLTDNNKFMLLDDTSLMKVRIRFPSDVIREYRFDNDTLRFIPAAATNGSGENTASVEFHPSFIEDGFYELIVSGEDRSGNSTGLIEYKVTFSVVNKPMISNLLNYPNPFTTSTAFVFTLTGSELPQNMKIQILTITGKVVREITKEELGPIRIGRNITDFKWDGTDQYGQKLANGVYLYRVVTNLNGKSLDKLELDGFNGDRYSDKSTDKYFKSGYGKMYLMR